MRDSERICLAVRWESLNNLPPGERDLLELHAISFEAMGGGIYSIIITAGDVRSLDIDWHALNLGPIKSILARRH